MQHIGDSGGMIAQRLRQTFTGFPCRVPREPGPLLEVPGFRFLEVVPAVALGRDTHGRNVTELRQLAAFSRTPAPPGSDYRSCWPARIINLT